MVIKIINNNNNKNKTKKNCTNVVIKLLDVLNYILYNKAVKNALNEKSTHTQVGLQA